MLLYVSLQEWLWSTHSFLPISNHRTLKWGSVNLHLLYLSCEFFSVCYYQSGRTKYWETTLLPLPTIAVAQQSKFMFHSHCMSQHGSAGASADHSCSETQMWEALSWHGFPCFQRARSEAASRSWAAAPHISVGAVGQSRLLLPSWFCCLSWDSVCDRDTIATLINYTVIFWGIYSFTYALS